MARPNPFGWLHEAVEAYGSSFETFSEKAAESLIASAKRNISTFYDMANELYHCFVNENNPEFEVYTKLLQTDMGFYDELMQLKTYSCSSAGAPPFLDGIFAKAHAAILQCQSE